MHLETRKDKQKMKLASNPSTPVDVLRALAQDEDWVVRSDVAENPSTPIEVLRALAKDESVYVRRWVAEHPNTPEDVLHYLAKDVEYEVREQVAQNPKSSSKILVMQFEYEKSLREPDEDVIRALYANENLPPFAKRVIETLFGDLL